LALAGHAEATVSARTDTSRQT